MLVVVAMGIGLGPTGGARAAGLAEGAGMAAPRTPPNVLLILTDDVGFGASSTFGGPVPTPTLDGLAAEGLRYNNFHVTAQCSSTRAALLTGRNPHAVGMGEIPESGRLDPGYTTVIPRSAALIPRILRERGYRTAGFGKYHLIPKWELSAVGPFDHWPTSMGFDHFYGFEPAMTDMFTPNLIENTRILPPPQGAGYAFERDLADRAIHWLREGRAAAPGKPFFVYYAPAAAHAPVQAPEEWIAKFRGRFDRGWDVEREAILARQKRLGVVPQDAVLTPRAAGVPAWDALGDAEKRVAARMMEVFAASLAFADHQIGRVLAELQASGQYDNTLVVYVQGDNGTSPEGGVRGYFNYYNMLNTLGLRESGVFAEDPVELSRRLDQIGGPDSAPAIPTGWTNALNTPFPGWKSDAWSLGGQRTGMVISWPAGIRAGGSVRQQFHFVTDIAPTIYEIVGLDPPRTVDGARQQKIDGVSLAYTFDAPAVPSRRREQYFENRGTLAMYRDGWWAGYTVQPGEVLQRDSPFGSNWQLYDLNTDFSQARDLASTQPRKLRALQALFRREAARNSVFPIGRRSIERRVTPAMEDAGRYVLHPGTERYSDWGFPNVRNRSWSVTAYLDSPPGGGSGVIVNQGGRFAGWGILLLDGVPHFVYRSTDTDQGLVQLRAAGALAAGPNVIEVRFAETVAADSRNGGGAGPRSAEVTMSVNGRVVERRRVGNLVRSAFMYQGAAIGHSTGSALTDDYAGRFEFTGTIDRVEFQLDPRR
jgi:arylsulfatase A-like enzyme